MQFDAQNDFILGLSENSFTINRRKCMAKVLAKRTHLDTKRDQTLKNSNKGKKIERAQGGKK